MIVQLLSFMVNYITMGVFNVEPEMKKKKKKKKVKYHVLFVPNTATVGIKQFAFSLKFFTGIAAAVGVLLLAAFIYCYFLTNHIVEANASVNLLRGEVDVLEQERDTLTVQNKELQDKVSILSDTINGQVEQQEAREAEEQKLHTPTGFPLKGTAAYNEENISLDDQPIAIFTAGAGTSVIATATGTVSAIAGDAEVGYIIMVDHGNGYFSVYRNASEPKVTEGQEVTTATELYNIEAGKEELGYQIIEKDTYIDPLTLMEIYG